MSGVRRFSVTVPEDLLEEFDALVSELGCTRSSAIQRAMRQFMAEHSWMSGKGTVAGVLAVIYDHEARGADEVLIDVQHRFLELVSASLHVHLDERNCLLAIAIRGDVKRVKKLVVELEKIRGVKQVRALLFPTV